MTPEDVARQLIRLYRTGQSVWTLFKVVDLPAKTQEDLDRAHEKYPFLPSQEWRLHESVCALVAAEWPRLNRYLTVNIKDQEKLEKVVPEVCKLVCKGKHMESKRSQEDLAEAARVRRREKLVRVSETLLDKAYKSNLRGSWNTVKR